MTDDAAPCLPTLAERLSAPIAAADPQVNALHDALNRALPRLWWPLMPPSAGERMAAPQHALYAVHAALGIGLAALLAPPRGRRGIVAIGSGLAAASWIAFTGAWDRRADARRLGD